MIYCVSLALMQCWADKQMPARLSADAVTHNGSDEKAAGCVIHEGTVAALRVPGGLLDATSQ
ncbi:MAG: hypothetical protein ACREYC_20305 [Gammaproteobacteria bacterium]